MFDFRCTNITFDCGHTHSECNDFLYNAGPTVTDVNALLKNLTVDANREPRPQPPPLPSKCPRCVCSTMIEMATAQPNTVRQRDLEALSHHIEALRGRLNPLTQYFFEEFEKQLLQLDANRVDEFVHRLMEYMRHL